MSIKLMSQVWEREDLDPHECLVMLSLADHADAEGSCYPSVQRICRRTGMKERGVQSVVKRLIARGFLSIRMNAGKRGTNLYTLHLTPAPDAPPQQMRGAPDAPPPRTECGSTPAPDAPEPSGTVNEPSVKVAKATLCVRRFSEFWDAYPHRDGKRNRKGAEAKYRAAVKRGIPEQTIIDGARAAHHDRRVRTGYARDPTTWLNQEGWTDQSEPQQPHLKAVEGTRNDKPTDRETRATRRLNAFIAGARG